MLLGKLWKMLKNRYIKLVATERRRNYLLSGPNYHTAKLFRKSFGNRNQKNSNAYE